MASKTIDVERVKEIVNNLLANSTDDVTPAERLTAAHVLEIVLMDTGNYKGYGHVPGTWDFTMSPPKLIGDESRRQYY